MCSNSNSNHLVQIFMFKSKLFKLQEFGPTNQMEPYANQCQYQVTVFEV